MLELIFQGFLEWTYGLILECWEYFSSVLFDLMSLDVVYQLVLIGLYRCLYRTIHRSFSYTFFLCLRFFTFLDGYLCLHVPTFFQRTASSQNLHEKFRDC